jgi:hypothetical protein
MKWKAMAMGAAVTTLGVTASLTAPASAQAQEEFPVLGHYRTHPGETVWWDSVTAAENEYGAFSGHLRNYHAPGEEPLDGTTEEGKAERKAIQAGKKLHLSWRPYPKGGNWADVKGEQSGKQLRDVMRRLKSACGDGCTDVWLSIVHEPELDWRDPDNCGEVAPCEGFENADYRRMWQEVFEAREDVGADKVKLVWIVQGFREHWDKKLYKPLWPGNDKVDIVGQDPYIKATDKEDALGKRMIEGVERFQDESDPQHDFASKPHIFAEYGCDLGGEGTRGDAEHRGNCIDGVREALPEIVDIPNFTVIEMEFFDARSNWISDDNKSPDNQAYRDLKNATP